MELSSHSVESLIDLVENTLSLMEVWDRDDRREVMVLQRCLKELGALMPDLSSNRAQPGASQRMLVRRGRKPRAAVSA